MTKIEKIQELLEGAEQDTRKANTADILDTLADFLKDGVAENEKAGMRAAIAIIKANHR